MNATADQFEFWRAALESGSKVEYEKGFPRAGYYRIRDRNDDRSIRWDAVAIWYDDDGLNCWRTGPRPAPTDADAIEELFVSCNSSPISYELYTLIAGGGAWPEEVAAIETPAADLPPHEAATAELTAQREAMAAWIKEIGAVKTQEQCDKAANYADTFAKLEKRAAETHKSEKAPWLEGGRQVDSAWKPVIERAAELKAYAKKSSEPFLIAEKARLAAEAKRAAEEAAKVAREAEAARLEAERAGAPPPVVEAAPIAPPPVATAKAGTSGRAISVRSYTVHKITDVRALLGYFADMNETPRDLMDTLQLLVNRMRAAGVTLPGVETKTEERAA